ncbi:phosphotransferase [Deinococcus misasensis]|uniref:phosphotransferase n=1 Tax=Deinococcus misasensis TaxID=392413 RepID=UPI00146FD599|nr:phosphotransferase [Deinococcus misasensis]
MTAEIQTSFFARALILHPHEPRVLLENGTLPHLSHPESLYMGSKVPALFERYGKPSYLQRLHLEQEQLSEDSWNVRYVFALVATLLDLPEGCVWTNPDLLPEDLQLLASRALNPDPKLPWHDKTWLPETLNWTRDALQDHSWALTGDPELIKSWQISVLYRLPTSGGPVYLKSVPDFFAREGHLTHWLHALNKGAAPKVLKNHPEQRIFLMQGAGQDKVEASAARSAVELLATVQRQTETHTHELLALGCLDRRCSVLKTHFQDLLNDEKALSVNNLLSVEEQNRLKNALPLLLDLLEELDHSPIAPTLLHGDLHLGNVVAHEGHLTFLDWSDGAIGHPFLDMNSEYLLESEDSAEHQTLVDAYLEHWTDVLPLDDLRLLQQKAVIAGELHRAVSYHRYIIPGVPDHAEWAEAPIDHLKNVLKWLEKAKDHPQNPVASEA